MMLARCLQTEREQKETELSAQLANTSTTSEKIQSFSYFQPRTLEGYNAYFQSNQIAGWLEKQSSKPHARGKWKKRYFVMEEQSIYYYKTSNVPRDPTTAAGYIPLDLVVSIRVAKQYDDATFEIILPDRTYTLKAKSKEEMQDWLFEFQRSIARVISILRTRGNRITRKTRCKRSTSFDYQHACLPPEVFLKVKPGETRVTSPKYSSPPHFSHAPQVFALEIEEELEEFDIEIHEPVAVPAPRRYIPPHLRRQATPAVPDDENLSTQFDLNLEDTEEKVIPLPPALNYGLTTLIGPRLKMEDVCSCIPDFNIHKKTLLPQHQSFYAVYDGHSGHQAATYVAQRLPVLLSEHPAFESKLAVAFTDSLGVIDQEYLEICRREDQYDGTTVAVVFRRANMLYTASLGDSRAVVSVRGVAHEVIEEITPGHEQERERIEVVGGWVTEERELQMERLHTMDLEDPAVRECADKVVRWLSVYRVNGELGVSRAIGDRDYKLPDVNEYLWLFPDAERRVFAGDLISAVPVCTEFALTPHSEFFILACDGLWDVIDSQNAVDHVRRSLQELHMTPQQASDSLARLALRYGSSDNVSVIVVALNDQDLS